MASPTLGDKQQIMAALRAAFEELDALAAGMGAAELSAPRPGTGWSLKDELAHLHAWQQRSIARMEAAAAGREPLYPPWPADLDPETPVEPDALNAWLHARTQARPWPEVYEAWRTGFLRLLELGAAAPEAELLQVDRYPWLEGYALADVLRGSCEHHEEHLERLRERPPSA